MKLIHDPKQEKDHYGAHVNKHLNNCDELRFQKQVYDRNGKKIQYKKYRADNRISPRYHHKRRHDRCSAEYYKYYAFRTHISLNIKYRNFD